MTQETQQTVSYGEPESIPETFKLKLAFTQRNWQRAKEQSSRLYQKISKMQKESQGWLSEKKELLSKIQKLEKVINRQKQEKQQLVKKLQLRTQRHHVEQSKTLSFEEKEKVEGKVRRTQAQMMIFKDERQIFNKKYQSMSSDLDEERMQTYRLRQQVMNLQKQSIQDLDAMQSVENLYKEKLNILQSQNASLKKQMDSLVIDMRLLQRKNEIEGLLSYQDNIGLQRQIKSTRNKKTARTLNFDENLDPNFQYYDQLDYEIEEKDELITLLKQKNSRLQKDIEGLKRRCSNLQNIICSSGSH